MLRAPAIVLCLCFALVAGSTSAREEWYDHYQAAIESLQGGEPEQAIRLLQAALARKERSGYLRTYGNNYIRYVPYYYLGVAQHAAGDCSSALESFRRSSSAGETDPVPELGLRLDSLRNACQAKLSPPEIVESRPQPEPVPELPPVEPLIDAVALERGLRAYLNGDFDAAIVALEDLTRESPESARLRLLLGMSFHGAWVVDPERDERLIARARKELSEAARLSPEMVPDPAICPPRVVELYRSLR